MRAAGQLPASYARGGPGTSYSPLALSFLDAQTKLPDSEVRIRPDYLRIHPEIEESRRGAKRRLRERWFVWHGILFEEPNPTGSRPRDLIGLEKQHMKPHPPNTRKGKEKAQRQSMMMLQSRPPGGGREPPGGGREKKERPKRRQVGRRKIWGSAAARPTLTPGLVYGGPQVRDHVPLGSVNPKAR